MLESTRSIYSFCPRSCGECEMAKSGCSDSGRVFDFVEQLGPDISSAILELLDDTADLVRVAAVSRSWRRYVITSGLCKKLCIKLFPEVSSFTHVEEKRNLITREAESCVSAEWKNLESEHRIFAQLTHSLKSPSEIVDCIARPLVASSTDNYPVEGIQNTMEPRDQVRLRPSYWSSRGARDPSVPESLTYCLYSALNVVDEIMIKPFEAYFQPGHPIYSAKAVRFKMGYPAVDSPTNKKNEYPAVERSSDGRFEYIWTYISPEFPMLQKNILQSFKLPRPVLCMGGLLQIEFLGRVQTQEVDDLYYVCVTYVKALGYSLPPALEFDIIEHTGDAILRYYPEKMEDAPTRASEGDGRVLESLTSEGGSLESLLVLGGFIGEWSNNDDDDDDDDDDDLLDADEVA